MPADALPASQAVSGGRIGGYFETLPERLSAVGLVILTVIEGLLGMRFLLHAFGANPNSGFVGFIDDVSWAFARPFADVFSSRSWSEGIIEVSTLVAMGFYLVLFAIHRHAGYGARAAAEGPPERRGVSSPADIHYG